MVEEKLEGINLGSTGTGFTACLFDWNGNWTFSDVLWQTGSPCLSGTLALSNRVNLFAVLTCFWEHLCKGAGSYLPGDKSPGSLSTEGLSERQCGCPFPSRLSMQNLHLSSLFLELGMAGGKHYYDVLSGNNSAFQETVKNRKQRLI